MSECYLARCQHDRKTIRREFNKWTGNILLQIGLEAISKNHFQHDIISSNETKNEQIPNDFNPSQPCLFCINRQEYFSNQDKTHVHLNDEENSPLDLSSKATQNLHSGSFFDTKSDILPMYNQEELLLSSRMNFDYLYPNMNLFSSNPTFLQDDYITQLAKQMAYSRMIQEIEYQRNDTKSKVSTNVFDSSSILTESMQVNHLLNDTMTRMLNGIFEEQIKQQSRVSRQGELLFVKKQNINNDDLTISNAKKHHKHNNQLNPSSSNSSTTSSVSSTYSSSIQTKNKNKAKFNHASIPIPSQQHREILSNSKVTAAIDGKQIRPKRGQYRRYESEQLAKAVVAVLSNEMSVHKAGSYFGVPHSTLEYKVKERNYKPSTTPKNKNESSSSMSANKSMEYDDTDHPPLSSNTNLHHKINDEENRLYIPVEFEMS